MGDSTIVRDEITKPYNEDVEAKSYKEKKIDEKKVTRKMQNFFRYIFINYYSIIDTCQRLVLFDKISNKMKTFITFITQIMN